LAGQPADDASCFVWCYSIADNKVVLRMRKQISIWRREGTLAGTGLGLKGSTIWLLLSLCLHPVRRHNSW